MASSGQSSGARTSATSSRSGRVIREPQSLLKSSDGKGSQGKRPEKKTKNINDSHEVEYSTSQNEQPHAVSSTTSPSTSVASPPLVECNDGRTSACSNSSADTCSNGGHKAKPETRGHTDGAPSGKCDNLHCVRQSRHQQTDEPNNWNWCKDKIVKRSGVYKPWFPQFGSQLMNLASSEIDFDLSVIKTRRPPEEFYVNQRVQVEYDDGITYPGTITGTTQKGKWRIRLDEGTIFTTNLPDPDVTILQEGGPQKNKKRRHA